MSWQQAWAGAVAAILLFFLLCASQLILPAYPASATLASRDLLTQQAGYDLPLIIERGCQREKQLVDLETLQLAGVAQCVFYRVSLPPGEQYPETAFYDAPGTDCEECLRQYAYDKRQHEGRRSREFHVSLAIPKGWQLVSFTAADARWTKAHEYACDGKFKGYAFVSGTCCQEDTTCVLEACFRPAALLD